MRRRKPDLPLPADADCRQVGAVLQSYLDGELGPDDAGVVAAHLEHCERCGIESETVAQVIDVIRRQRPDLDPQPIERLAGFVERLEQDPPDGDA
jgi:anti-sigma factor RsiW